MNSRQPKLLLTLALALFAYIMVYERPQQDDTNGLQTVRLMPGVTPTSVNRIEFTTTNELVTAELRDHRWQMVFPVPYAANKIAIDSLLAECSRLESQHAVKDVEISQLSDFGLNPPRGTLTIYQGSTEIKLHLGAVTPQNDQLYVRPEGAKDIAVISAKFMRLLPVNSALWRSPYLLDLANTDFNRIQIRNNNSSIVLENGTNNRWRVISPLPPKRADSVRIRQLIDYWKKWKVVDFPQSTQDTSLDDMGLGKPELELSFSKGTNQLLSVQFGGAPANLTNAVFARLPISGDILVAEATPIQTLRWNYWDFCDRRMIDPLAESQFDIIEVRGPENFRLRRGTNMIWRAENAQQTAMDPALMLHFLDNLMGIEAVELEKEVVTDYAEYALVKPLHSYHLYRSATNSAGKATNIMVAGIDFGKNRTIDSTYAKRHDENFVYVIPRARLELLPKALYKIRNRYLWSFFATNVAAVTVFNDVKTNRLNRLPNGQWIQQTSKGNTPLAIVENAATEEGVDRLGLLNSKGWISRGTNKFGLYQIGPRMGGITFELKEPTGLSYKILFGRWPENRNVYAAYQDPLDGQWVIFEFPSDLYEEYILEYFYIKEE